ncbi:MAG: radical SAM protein [Trueperaceae bacterium]
MPGRSPHDHWRIAVQPTATVLSPSRSEVVSYDLEGRVRSWFVDGTVYKRTLASDVVARRSEPGDVPAAARGPRHRWAVPDDEADALFARAAALAEAAQGAAEAVPANARTELRARLQDARVWSPERLRAERGRFAAAYAPIPILPPDQYGAVVLQATFGCSWNRCTFCSFYQDRPFQVRPPAAFDAHVAAVAELFGRAAADRRGVFLADGNALVLANARLRPILDAARDAFPDRPFAGFVDVFSGERKSVDDWRELRALGLERVAIGVETGHDPLLAWLNKPGGADAAAAFVADLKRAGLRVAIILMVGVGGARFAEAHVRDTAALLERLAPGAGDVVYLSPFVVHPGSGYAERAAGDGVQPLEPSAIAEQYRVLRAAARDLAPRTPVARYDIDEFVY